MLNKFPRMTDWFLITLVLIVIIAVLKPELLPVALYKMSLITMAAVAGYWIDRSLFPYARPDGYLSLVSQTHWQEQVKHHLIRNADVPVAEGYGLIFAIAMLRRAIIVGCAMLAVSLGM